MNDYNNIKLNDYISLAKVNIENEFVETYLYDTDDMYKAVRIKDKASGKQVGRFLPMDKETPLTFNYKAYQQLPESEKDRLEELNQKFIHYTQIEPI